MLNGQMHSYIGQYMGAQSVPQNLRLMVVRSDGLMVWDAAPDNHSQSLAALCGGVWEASRAMALAAGKQSDQSFRLVFDTSDQGVLIFPFEASSQKFFLTAIYEKCLNPGVLKRQVQNVSAGLAKHLSGFKQKAPAVNKTEVREGYLFSDISDEEMDRLFGI